MFQYIITIIIIITAIYFSVKKILRYFSNKPKCIDPDKKCEGCELSEICRKK